MSRMSGPTRKAWYEFLSRRDGERCLIGGEDGTYNSLVVDHWNGNNSDNRSPNLHLLCRQMNAIKNPRGNAISRKSLTEDELLSSMCVRRVEAEDTVRALARKAQSTELMKNLQFEPNFKHWLFRCIVHARELDLDKVVVNGAFHVGCSDDSIKRYIKRLVCIAGFYQLDVSTETGFQIIRLKPKWEGFRKRNEDNARLNKQARNWKESDVDRSEQTSIIRPESFERKANGTK